MIGPVPVPHVDHMAPAQLLTAPSAADSADSPSRPLCGRQPLNLPTERVDLPGDARDPSQRRTTPDERAPDAEARELPMPPNAGVTFRLVDELGHRIQSRVIHRGTREVLRSVPSDQALDFMVSFRTATRLDVEA